MSICRKSAVNFCVFIFFVLYLPCLEFSFTFLCSLFEQKMMLETQFSGYEAHKKIHEEFIDRLHTRYFDVDFAKNWLVLNSLV